jgi:Headcase protein family homologue
LAKGACQGPANFSPSEKKVSRRCRQVALKFDRLNGPWPCCAPKGCLYHNGNNAEHILITQEDLRFGETIRVICSNENCYMSPYMHAACFQAFEESVLVSNYKTFYVRILQICILS